MAVFDTVYNPAETLLLRQAEEAGAKTIDGLLMFISQAAARAVLRLSSVRSGGSYLRAIRVFILNEHGAFGFVSIIIPSYIEAHAHKANAGRNYNEL